MPRVTCKSCKARSACQGCNYAWPAVFVFPVKSKTYCHAVYVLVMLDLSAAFDAIDHQILFLRLEKSLGISGSALSWIKSYLSNRSMYVAIGDVA